MNWARPLLLVLALAGCAKPRFQVPTDYQAKRDSIPVALWRQVRYQYTDSARLKAVLAAPYVVEHYNRASNEKVQHLDSGFVLVFYAANGDTESVITADRGQLFASGRALAEGNVVVRSAKGERLQTEQLTWLREADKITTDKPVAITTLTEVLYGVGLESNTRFTDYTIYKLNGTVQLTETPVAPAPPGG